MQCAIFTLSLTDLLLRLPLPLRLQPRFHSSLIFPDDSIGQLSNQVQLGVVCLLVFFSLTGHILQLGLRGKERGVLFGEGSDFCWLTMNFPLVFFLSFSCFFRSSLAMTFP